MSDGHEVMMPASQHGAAIQGQRRHQQPIREVTTENSTVAMLYECRHIRLARNLVELWHVQTQQSTDPAGPSHAAADEAAMDAADSADNPFAAKTVCQGAR